MEGLKTSQELDEVRPDGLLRKLRGFAGSSHGYLLEQVTAVAKLHHDTQSRCTVLHERLLV